MKEWSDVEERREEGEKKKCYMREKEGTIKQEKKERWVSKWVNVCLFISVKRMLNLSLSLSFVQPTPRPSLSLCACLFSLFPSLCVWVRAIYFSQFTASFLCSPSNGIVFHTFPPKQVFYGLHISTAYIHTDFPKRGKTAPAKNIMRRATWDGPLFFHSRLLSLRDYNAFSFLLTLLFSLCSIRCQLTTCSAILSLSI